MEVICSHVLHCTQPERDECPHSTLHEPMDWADTVKEQLVDDKFGMCNVINITCNAGSDGTVICEPIQDGDYVISTKGVPIKLHVIVKGNEVTYRDGTMGDIQDLHNWTFEQIEFRPPPDPESLTCFRCKDKDICKYANDPYNTDGDCLATK